MIFVNVTIIYGTKTKSSTYNCVELLLNNLRLNMNIEVTEFLLPKYLPNFFYGHLSCFVNNKNTYSPLSNIDNIVNSINESDLIILTCPVLSCDISSEMKSFLDYLSYKSLENKSESIMRNKIGLIMSTSLGAGLPHAIHKLKRIMISCGASNTFTFSKTFYEMNWQDVTLKSKMHITKKLFKLSNKIISIYIRSHPIKNHVFNKISFMHKQTILNQYPCNVIDIDFNERGNLPHLHIKNTNIQ